MSKPAPKRLNAEDAEGLQVLSAAVQDAVLKPEDIDFSRKTRSVSLEMNRFHWETADRPPFFRSRSIVRFDAVTGIRSSGVPKAGEDVVLQLLAVSFTPGDEPGGTISLTFAGGSELELRVECIDVVLLDTDKVWPALRRPDHDRDHD